MSSFVGRRQATDDLRELVRRPGLVTVVGSPGVGKTRLALEVARAVARTSCDVFWVEIASVGRAEMVAEAVSAALGVPERAGSAVRDEVARHLADRRALLVLDNCEHLVDVCRLEAQSLLRSCPGLTVLATSREPLGADGENVWMAPPLSAADGEALFYVRASASQVGFAVSDESAAAVARVCACVAGVPLAIELAAGRVGMLSPTEIATRLAEDPLGVLGNGSGGSCSRHQSLRATLDWSYGLLSLPEKALLGRLAVFSGGATEAAVQHVCAKGRLTAAKVPALLGGLVAKSLVVAEVGDDGVRYRLLDTVRRYAFDRLAQSREALDMSARHATWYRELAEDTENELTGAHQLAGLARLDAEEDNLRAAFEWLLGQAGDDALRLAASLTVWWRVRGRFHEGRRALEAALAQSPGAPTGLRAKGLWGAGFLAQMLGDEAAATARLTEALDLAREADDDLFRARSLLLLGNVAMDFGGTPRGRLRKSASLARRVGDSWCEGHALALMGRSELSCGRPGEAQRLLERAVDVARLNGDLQGLRIGLHLLGEVGMFYGDEAAAEGYLVEGLAVCRALGDAYGVAAALTVLGELAYWRGAYEWATETLNGTLSLEKANGAVADLVSARVGLGFVAVDTRQFATARRHFEEARARSGNDQRLTSQILRGLALVAAGEGDYRQARSLLDQAIAAATSIDNRRAAAGAISILAELTAWEGHPERAFGLWRRALAIHRDVGDPRGVALSLELFAGAAISAGECRNAVLYFGASEAIRTRHGCRRSPGQRRLVDQHLAVLRGQLPTDEVEAAWTEGLGAPDAVVNRAIKGHLRRRRPARGWSSLTDTEREVVRLVADGHTNREIAALLLISPNTVVSHVAHVFAKLGVTSRTELARLARSGERP